MKRRQDRGSGLGRNVACSLLAAGATLAFGLMTLVGSSPAHAAAPAPSSVAYALGTKVPSGLGSVLPGTNSPLTLGLKVVDNHVVGPLGKTFVPYGFVLYCLAETSLRCEQGGLTDSDKIEAAAKYWHANTIRIQVAQENLFSQSPYDASYLTAIENEVHLVNSLGMVAILTLQEEEFKGPDLPTASAIKFWTFMAAQFRNHPRVMFDLYNEPRLKPLEGTAWMWNIWRNGGQVDTDGVDADFVGMQAVVDAVRATGARNVVIAEGNFGDRSLSELPTHLLTGANIAYGMEPDLSATDHDPAEWDATYGNLAKQVPIMMEAFQDDPMAGSCYPDSPTVLPELLSYLKSKQLGLLSWTLAPGNMMVGNDPDQPTSYTGARSQLCVVSDSGREAVGDGGYESETNANGPGATILSWFKANSRTLLP